MWAVAALFAVSISDGSWLNTSLSTLCVPALFLFLGFFAGSRLLEYEKKSSKGRY